MRTGFNGSFASFPNLEESAEALAELYTRKYAGKSPEAIVSVYAGNPQSQSYWEDVRTCYSTNQLMH